MLRDYGPRRVGDLAAPISFGIATRVTQSRCQIQLTITSAIHTNSLSRIIMCLGNALTGRILGHTRAWFNGPWRLGRGAWSAVLLS